MKSKRPILGALVVTTIASASLLVTAVSASGAPDQEPQVTICHRTNSVTHPYNKITVDDDAVYADTGNDNGQVDHTTHTGPLFDAENPPPPPHNGDQWGDIIPPFYADGTTMRPDGAPTLNWPDGEAIFNNDCNPTTPVEVGNVAVHKTVVNPDAVSIPSEFDIELVCTTDAGATTVLDEQLSLAGDSTSDLFEVPAGASCDATETTGGIANLVSAVSDGPVTIVAEGDSTVTVTNTFAATPVGPEVAPEVVTDPAPVAVAPAAVAASPQFTG
jgi:hypothetical protein